MKKLFLFILFPFLTYGQVQIGQDIDGEANFDRSGNSVSISDDGTIVAIGAPGNSGNGNSAGQVRVYENNEGIWTQIGQDIDGEVAEDRSGGNISLSSNGTIVAIGARLNNGNGEDSGHVRVYENLEGVWTQIGQDIDGEATEDRSGFSVSLSSNGTIVAIGARLNNGNGGDSGHVRIYENLEGIWTQIGQDINGETSGDQSGNSVSLSANGTIVAIGSIQSDTNGFSSGQVRIFENQGGNWTQIGQNINGDIGSQFGIAVRISSDGTIIAVGANSANTENSITSGVVKVYQNQEGVWTQIGEDINGQESADNFGFFVDLSVDGNVVAISSIGSNGFSGRVQVYKNEDQNWIQVGGNIDSENAGDQFGRSLSLSSDGGILAIGAPINSGNGDSSGHVRVFDLKDLLTTEEFTTFTFSLYPNPASTQVTIDIPQENTLEKVTIYTNLGQVVTSSKNTTIDTSTLSQGIYMVEVKTNQGTSSKKLIVE